MRHRCVFLPAKILGIECQYHTISYLAFPRPQQMCHFPRTDQNKNHSLWNSQEPISRILFRFLRRCGVFSGIDQNGTVNPSICLMDALADSFHRSPFANLSVFPSHDMELGPCASALLHPHRIILLGICTKPDVFCIVLPIPFCSSSLFSFPCDSVSYEESLFQNWQHKR